MSPRIEPVEEYGQGRTGGLHNITAEGITARLGFPPNQDDDPAKVVNSWGFTVDGVRCAVWDYRGSHLDGRFSTWGPREALAKVFSEHVTE